VEAKINQAWRKSRIAARLWLKKQAGQWNDRDRRLAARLSADPAVTNRLMDQAVKWLKAPRHP
jgi:hypothetical protein